MVYIFDSCKTVSGNFDNNLLQDILHEILNKINDIPTVINTHLESILSDVIKEVEKSLNLFKIEMINFIVLTASFSNSCTINISTYPKILQNKPTVIIKPKNPVQNYFRLQIQLEKICRQSKLRKSVVMESLYAEKLMQNFRKTGRKSEQP